MPHYLVISPKLSILIPILDDGTGPLEDFHCVVSIEAHTKREAKALAIRQPEMKEWVENQRRDGASPFTGLKVEVG